MYKKINKKFDYAFNVKKDGVYAVLIEASCKSGKLFGLFGGEDLRVEIDETRLREISAKNKQQYYDIPPSWNGTQLKGLSKIAVFILWLAKGEHVIKFIPRRGATITRQPEITVFDPRQPVIENIQAQDGNRRPWMTIAIVGLPLKTVDIAVSCEKRGRDSDDAKIIINNKTQKNEQKGWWGKNWYWRGSELQGRVKEAGFYPDLPKGIHYVELWADRMPTLKSLKMNVGTSEKVVIRPYKYRGVSGNEDYNRYDTEILAAVDYWNGQFLKDTDPPQEPLDPNLVKAMIFVESRIGYYPGGEVDVMQVGNPVDGALEVLNGTAAKTESWIHNGEEVELNYHGEANADSPKDSIWWGVRWLYHKAQGITYDGKRYWNTWKEAMEGYGPQKKEHNDAIWSIYKNGIDTRENKSVRLWSFALIAFLFALLLNYGIFELRGTQDTGYVSGVMDKKTNRIEINKYIDQYIIEAFDEYRNQPENYWELFSPLRTLCEDGSCERMLVTDGIRKRHIGDLIIHVDSPQELVTVMAAMDALEPHTWEYEDIDNDGKKELVFVDLDVLNHEFLDVVVVDIVDGSLASFSKRFEDYHYFSSPDSMLDPVRPLKLLDVTGDAVPEILVFGSWGRMGARLGILQYAAGAIKDREFVDDFTYPVYTFYDKDHDGVLEISVSGDDPCSFGVYAYSCGSMYKDAIIKYNKTTDSFVYSRI